jgi:phospholipid transport system transporter-binding protein
MIAGPAAASFELVAGAAGQPFRLAGVASLATARALLERGSALFGTLADVEVDLSAVTHVDSAGLAVLLAWLGRARRGGRVLRYRSIPAQLRGLARISAVEEMLQAAEVRR